MSDEADVEAARRRGREATVWNARHAATKAIDAICDSWAQDLEEGAKAFAQRGRFIRDLDVIVAAAVAAEREVLGLAIAAACCRLAEASNYLGPFEPRHRLMFESLTQTINLIRPLHGHREAERTGVAEEQLAAAIRARGGQ